ncbi:hypothetical protein ALC57_06529, partial [Trachymyrmex cornetzi]
NLNTRLQIIFVETNNISDDGFPVFKSNKNSVWPVLLI